MYSPSLHLSALPAVSRTLIYRKYEHVQQTAAINRTTCLAGKGHSKHKCVLKTQSFLIVPCTTCLDSSAGSGKGLGTGARKGFQQPFPFSAPLPIQTPVALVPAFHLPTLTLS